MSETSSITLTLSTDWLGLAVDGKNGWICHLSYTHKVAMTWEGRHCVARP